MLLGDKRLEDSLLSDGLTCSLDHVSMGLATEQYGRLEGIGRERQDALALSSFERASRAWSEGRMSEEVVRVVDADGGGLDQDECLRTGITEEALARLNPVFDAGGSITAGNSSPLCDGAAAVVVTTSARAAELGVECLGEIISYGQSAGPTPSLLTKPAVAMRSALVHSGYRLHDVDIFEINEAFAAVVAASSDELGISNECVNVNGGAIALGHPFGASGARLVITTLYELRRRGGGIGLAGLCAGGGQGEAVLLRVG
jgi:acetyl-CoA C-acetyltransferase